MKPTLNRETNRFSIYWDIILRQKTLTALHIRITKPIIQGEILIFLVSKYEKFRNGFASYQNQKHDFLGLNRFL